MGDHYIVNGEKIFIMHGDVCNYAVTFGKLTSDKSERPKVSAIIVSADAEDIPEKK